MAMSCLTGLQLLGKVLRALHTDSAAGSCQSLCWWHLSEETSTVAPAASALREVLAMQGIIAEIEAGDHHMADATGGIFIGTLFVGLVGAHLARLQAICYADSGVTLFAGNVRLSRLKQALADAGIAAQWQAGTLVCGQVIVKASPEDGEVHLEGPLAEDFFRVREIVHAQYHVC